jgi:hypothetical protein
VTFSFLSIAFVGIFAYWIYVITGPLHSLVTFVKDIFVPAELGAATYGELYGITGTIPQSFRGGVLFYGFYLFILIFIIILLYGLLPRLRYHRIEDLSFTLFLFVCGIGGLMALYLIPYEIGPYPDRFIMFGWLFAFAPLTAIILSRKTKWLIGVGIFLLFAFMLHNIYQIEPAAWDSKVGAEMSPSEEDYALAETFDFSSGKIAASADNLLAIYDVSNNLGEDFKYVDLSQYEWVIVNEEILQLEYYSESAKQAIAEMKQMEKGGSPDRNTIYQSSNLSVFKLRESAVSEKP